MKKSEIKVGGLYLAKVSGNVVTVRVDAIHEEYQGRSETRYAVTNLKTGRKTVFRSAAKFRCEVVEKPCPQCKKSVPIDENHPFGMHRECYERSNASKMKPKDAQNLLEESTSNRPFSEDMVNRFANDYARAEFNRRVDEALDNTPPLEGEESSDPTTTAPVATSIPADSDVGATSPASARIGLACKIAALQSIPQGRAVGTPVAGMTPNNEQELILEVAAAISHAAECGRALVIGAGAGTGKTATLKMLEEVLVGKGQYTAFNSSLVAESKTKFKRAACNTTHSLAFRTVGKLYQHRLPREGGPAKMRSGQIARLLGIESMSVPTGEVDKEGKPRTKTLSAEFLAGQVMVALKRFCLSADRCIEVKHLRYIPGIDGTVTLTDEDGEPYTRASRENNDKVHAYLLDFCRAAWADLTDVDGVLPFWHDVYVKLWQLGTGDDRPIIAADYILLDEAQDTAPVFLDLIQQQRHALLIMVGDENQQIYEWRGAVNAMGAFPGAPRRLLSQSYRFGQAVADVANTILAKLEEPTDLVMKGNPAIPSRVCPIESPRCYLYRTNAGAVGRVMDAIASGKKPHLIGGGAETVAWCEAAMELQAKKPTRHPELCCFEDWKEVQVYSKTDEGEDMRLMVRLIDTFGAKQIRDALKDMSAEKDADVVISTAHKSKGREWLTVKLGQDFPVITRMTDADKRLLYVAVTRAQHTLDLSDCPTFTGKEEGMGEQRHWVPGLEIQYSRPMPTLEEQTAWLEGKGIEATREKVAAEFNRAKEATEATKFTWTNYAGKWCLRGPKDVAEGSTVTAERKNGTTSTERIKGVVQKYNEAWIYSVGV